MSTNTHIDESTGNADNRPELRTISGHAKCEDPNCVDGRTWITNRDGKPERVRCGCMADGYALTQFLADKKPAERPKTETDAFREQYRHLGPNWLADQMAICSNRIERERDEAREAYENETASTLDLARKLASAERREADQIVLRKLNIKQMDEAREQRDHYIAENNRLLEELKAESKASFREQLDRLVEALRELEELPLCGAAYELIENALKREGMTR